MAIKAVILDIGGIVIMEKSHIAREILAKKFGFDSMKFREYTYKMLSYSYRGTLHYLDYFKGIIKELGIKATPEEMAKEWASARVEISSWIKPNKELLEKLNKKYVTVSLTNSTKLNDSIKIRQDVYKMFKINVISCDVGFRKPEKKIYEIALDKLRELDITPNEVVFVDDKEENILPAKELGMHTILVDEGEPIADKLKELGVSV